MSLAVRMKVRAVSSKRRAIVSRAPCWPKEHNAGMGEDRLVPSLWGCHWWCHVHPPTRTMKDPVELGRMAVPRHLLQHPLNLSTLNYDTRLNAPTPSTERRWPMGNVCHRLQHACATRVQIKMPWRFRLQEAFPNCRRPRCLDTAMGF